MTDQERRLQARDLLLRGVARIEVIRQAYGVTSKHGSRYQVAAKKVDDLLTELLGQLDTRAVTQVSLDRPISLSLTRPLNDADHLALKVLVDTVIDEKERATPRHAQMVARINEIAGMLIAMKQEKNFAVIDKVILALEELTW